MTPKNRAKLSDRVATAAGAALAAQNHVAPLDVLVGIGWLDPGAVKRWRLGQTGDIESLVQVEPRRVSEALQLFQAWAAARGLVASETDYLARSTERQALRFSQSGDPAAERLYCTHWVSPALSEAKRERLAQKASAAPELVVVVPLNDAWTCHRCGETGDLLMMENAGPACLRCVGLDDLEFLPTGEALVTRRAKAGSARHAVVVRFSRARRRYERQGLLVESQVLARVRRELGD